MIEDRKSASAFERRWAALKHQLYPAVEALIMGNPLLRHLPGRTRRIITHRAVLALATTPDFHDMVLACQREEENDANS